MKIVYLSVARIPSRFANSVHVMKMCNAFAANGVKATLFAPNFPTADFQDRDVYEFYGVKQAFDLEKLPWPKLKGAGHIYGRRAAQKAQAMQPDIVYGRDLIGCYWAVRYGLPTILEAHRPISSEKFMTRLLFKRMAGKPNFLRLVVISEALRNIFIEENSVSADKLLVAHDGADVDSEIVPAEELGSNDRLQVGYIGHLYKGRGVELIVTAAQAIPSVDFHVVGGTDDDVAYWRTQTTDTPNVYFHGFVPPARIAQYRAAFDVLLAPYQRTVTILGQGDTSKWMSPLKLFEYMAAGKAIVCSDLPVLREVLAHNDTALLCAPDNIDEWKRAILTLKEDRQLRNAIGENARSEFLARYTWKKRAQTVVSNIDPL